MKEREHGDDLLWLDIQLLSSSPCPGFPKWSFGYSLQRSWTLKIRCALCSKKHSCPLHFTRCLPLSLPSHSPTRDTQSKPANVNGLISDTLIAKISEPEGRRPFPLSLPRDTRGQARLFRSPRGEPTQAHPPRPARHPSLLLSFSISYALLVIVYCLPMLASSFSPVLLPLRALQFSTIKVSFLSGLRTSAPYMTTQCCLAGHTVTFVIYLPPQAQLYPLASRGTSTCTAALPPFTQPPFQNLDRKSVV